MTDVNPTSQGTLSFVQDPKQLRMQDLENIVTPVNLLCDSSGKGSHIFSDIATLGTVKANLASILAANFEVELTQPSSDGQKSSPLLPIRSIPG